MSTGAVNLGELEALSREELPRTTSPSFAGGAGDEVTLAENRDAFARLSLVPRVLRGPAARTTATTILGLELETPALVAPVAYQRAAHPDGELATARAAAAAGVAMCLSSLSTHGLEDVAAAAGPDAKLLFQLYPYRDRGMTDDVVRRAHAAGFRALVVTVDVAVHGLRERELRHAFALPHGCTLPCVPVPPDHTGPVRPHDVSSLMQPDLSWRDIERFMALTDLPVVLKGVLSVEDARIAADLGAAGVVVSNHGGRQLDTTPATIDVVGVIADAVGDRIDVLLDGGVRRGTDVVKALALGARAVLIGRPVLWALAATGQDGVRHALELLKAEIANALALAGCDSPAEATATLVRRTAR
ncbi:MAG: alpha-hydroxy acid oxidase [Solirubrobacteraceae bacterium]